MLLIVALALAGGLWAQQQPAPPLLGCGTTNEGVEILCGTRSPEDLEATPDGKYLIVSEFVNGGALELFDVAKKSYSKLPVRVEARKDWGDAACPGPVGEMLRPHGISLGKRAGGALQVYVVNHGGRQSMEMYELKRAAAGWELVWHGCALTMQEFNDVAVLKDGGFIATHPTALTTTDLFSGKPSGFVVRWAAGKGETELPGTRAAYPNGVLVSADERSMYFNAWTAKEVHQYDLKAGKETGMVKLDFLPDNITWDKKRMLAAGIKGRGSQGFGVAEIDPARMTAQTVFDSEGKGALIGGVSVALRLGDAIYVGAFQGDRLVKIERGYSSVRLSK
jgi:hypothetical protein